ncbi:hypothetical protein H2200_003942 [Cladophialophora chaetospira]|uniref:Uncharacterized protein n=1 Tax=Cladophialophora chaetospira TaxID=386627 RepID=A0AA38XF65_9EURO|nr:hypothetical protein H2200_003942 [Cladophialophora chaetospira]
MTDALDPVVGVHEGVWTNYSRGKVWGLTWTLCPTHAVIMTNTLAVLVTVCGVQLFNIIRYTLYRFGASRQPDTPHTQKQQNILKVAVSDMATAQGFLTLAWKQRRSSGGRSVRSYAIGLFAVFYTVLFWIAGIFSNKAISTSSTNGPWEVLSRSNDCGVWNQTYFDIVSLLDFSTEQNFEMLVQYKAKQAQDVQLSLEYAQECYFARSSALNVSSTCKTFKTPRLNYGNDYGKCPFPSELCHDSSETVVLDTGYLDSHDHIGINAKPQDRLKYRRITTCTVLNDTEYITGWNGTLADASGNPRPQPDAAHANFGPSSYKDTDWTYSFSNFASFFDVFSSQNMSPYQLDAEWAVAPSDPAYTANDFEPIPELAPKKADLTLLFLSYMGMYITRVDDPWFAAPIGAEFKNPHPYLEERFARNKAISTLGCTEQHEFCTTNNTCTGLGGLDQIQNVAKFNTALTPVQYTTFDRLLRGVSGSCLARMIENLALTTNPLLASNVTYTGDTGIVLSSALPSNQWTLELAYWHSIAMAHFQRTIFEWATGHIAPEPQLVQYLTPPQTKSDVWFCNNMILQSTIYQSFNLVAIILIVIFGTLIIIVGLNKENFSALINKRPRRSESRQDWEDDGMAALRSPWGPPPMPRTNLHQRRSRLHGHSEFADAPRVPSIHRVSSPTLPLEDRTMSISNWPLGPSSTSNIQESVPLAISLIDFESSTTETPRQMPASNGGRRKLRPLRVPPPIALLPLASSTRPTNENHDSWI